VSEIEPQDLSRVAQSLLLVLYIRAMESQRPDALLKDEKAVQLFTQMSRDFSYVKKIPLSEANKLIIILRTLEFDRHARDFLARHPDATVVHIGCGLDSRFDRVDDGRVEWYDLDFPEVIELRRRFIGGERERYHLLGCSVLEDAWLNLVRANRERPCLFLAEGVFMHLQAAQVKSLVLAMRNHFEGAALIFDAYSPVHLWLSNLLSVRAGFRCHWGLWQGREIEGWGDGIHLVNAGAYFHCPESRLDSMWWTRPVEPLLRSLRIYHFQLG
jgi:O-methyltransferase involved in polyketide biosynthesis